MEKPEKYKNKLIRLERKIPISLDFPKIKEDEVHEELRKMIKDFIKEHIE